MSSGGMFTRAGSRSAREHNFEEVNGRISVAWLSVRPEAGATMPETGKTVNEHKFIKTHQQVKSEREKSKKGQSKSAGNSKGEGINLKRTNQKTKKKAASAEKTEN